MLRYVLVLLVLVAVAPFVPGIVKSRIETTHNANTGAKTAENRAGEQIHKIQMSANGQFVTEARLNGRKFTMLVDTGASATAIPARVAEDIGIYLNERDYKLPVSTANGVTMAAAASLDDLEMGSIHLRNVDVIVLEDHRLQVPLLGMSALNQLERFDISGGTLVLVQ